MDNKMRLAFEKENPVPEGLVYQDFTDMYGPESEDANFSPINRAAYNTAWLHFQEGWDAAMDASGRK